ncbi:Isoleucine--tRNA ligase, cytoplasmic [Porphyridium purpureum]|uniref:isoleucine--tRNA ligase n=1 Tax=Porphyridium purpureum TaxID=35688 RepID=A0A5J4YWE7_PORPP|nr:Isoleucine--tRNA ligase, cytoplasmic [Porphyridium purpureum]|eukprot:POR1543..scf209_3
MEVPERLVFAAEERKILEYWNEIRAFEKSNELAKDRPLYSFYDGPPFATGLPHYGHILAGTIKDTVTRVAYQKGFRVPRRFGWDCHGLPVEYEIEQQLNIKSKDDVMRMGIEKYNAECRAIVMRYSSEWEHVVKRLGRWIDFENDYKTLDLSYMESVWWVFKQLWEKDLVYRGFRVMPYSTACTTPLSNFEANLNYKDVSDPAIVVSFPLVDDPDTAFIAWTTTPWTLPSNVALCVNPGFDYLLIEDIKTSKKYYIARDRLVQLYKDPKKSGLYKVLLECKGVDLIGKKYVPLFPYFVEKYGATAFRVLGDGYVTNDAGTGIVHQAPAFGEDDYRVCVEFKVVEKTDLPCPIDENGRFLDPVSDFKGKGVKEADRDIIHMIKDMGRLVKNEQLMHSYPFCWRSETPLIYRAVPSWFVRVEQLKDRLIKNNLESRWVPDTVQHKRFGTWLENARDWNISRNRYWGTPVPIWMDEETGECIVPGSIAELEELSGVSGISDLHRDTVDSITIKSRTGSGRELKRIEETMDCWMESGAMPYAQIHYPFTEESKTYFQDGFPADFIAEGLDQTRGWFYTLMVLSTALFDKPAFKNCVVNGLVLAEDGKKMSKRLRNYPDPMVVVEEHGADALRLYLINSPVVRAEPLRFREAGVKDVVKEVMLPWFHSFRFLIQNVNLFQVTHPSAAPICIPEGMANDHAAQKLTNPMDHWIQSAMSSLIHFVHQEMDAYRLYTVVPKLLALIEDLNNWYVRLNRPRLKGQVGDETSWRTSLVILADVLLTLSRLMAPFAPFFSEYVYQGLKRMAPESLQAESVHFLMLPEARDDLVDERFERAVALMQEAIVLGRVARERRNVSLKSPLRSMRIIHADPLALEGVKELEDYVRSELNIRHVEYSRDQGAYVTLKADADGRVLGKQLGKAFAAVHNAVKALSSEEIQALEERGSIEIAGHVLSSQDIKISREIRPEINQAGDFEVAGGGGSAGLLIVLNLERDQSLIEDGLGREFMNRIQKLRKKCGFVAEDKCEVFYDSESKELLEVLERQKGAVCGALRTSSVSIERLEHLPKTSVVLADEEVEKIGTDTLRLVFTRAGLVCSEKLLAKSIEMPADASDSRATVLVDLFAKLVVFRDPVGLGLVWSDGSASTEAVRMSVDGVQAELRLGHNVFLTTADRLAREAIES